MGSFDTTFIESLVAAGVPRDQARTLSEQLQREIDAHYGLHSQVLATKRDLAEFELKIAKEAGLTQERIAEVEMSLRIKIAELDSKLSTKLAELDTKLSARIAELDTKLSAKIAESNERIALTHSRIAEAKNETLRWTLGFMVAQTGILFAAFKLSV